MQIASRFAVKRRIASQPFLPPDDLTAVAARDREKRGLELVVVDQGLGLEDDPEAFELGPLAAARHRPTTPDDRPSAD